MTKYPDLHPLLHKYAKDLEAFKMECLKITHHHLPGKFIDDPLPKTQSKLGGIPFYPKAEFGKYPKDKDGSPMYLFAQFNFADLPHLQDFPEDGLLQFYVSLDYWEYDEFAIRYWPKEDLNKDVQTEFTFLETLPLYKCLIKRVHKMEFTKMNDWVGRCDNRFTFDFDGKSFLEVISHLPFMEKYELRSSMEPPVKIGGYGVYLQEDPRENNESLKDHILLFQIDEDSKCIALGEGRFHWLLHPEDLKNKKFENAHLSMQFT